MKSRIGYLARFVAVMAVLCAGAFRPVVAQQMVEPPNEAAWYFSPSVGIMHFEGDEPIEPGFLATARIGYDYSEFWSFEGSLYLMPYLQDRTTGQTTLNSDGSSSFQRVSMLGSSSTYGAGLAIDALYHFTRWERLDPFLVVGAGASWFADSISVNGKQTEASMRYGAGTMYHFNDEWAIRADFRGFFVNQNQAQANSMIDAGLVWNWGARVPQKLMAVGGPLDSDGDGLVDTDEAKWGTDPYDPDTDKDGLRDGDEVHKYRTDPLNPDTDYDALRDGDEVFKYKTDPLKRDTDNGGVADGHEVIEDGTDPLNGKDDLRKFELYIKFDYDKSIIKPEYFADLDVIGKVMRRHPKSEARVEGHADQVRTKNRQSSPSYNMSLSKRRAEAVADYLSKNCGIEKNHLTPVGYGFTRPKEKQDLVNGNPNNRRVEIYIKGAEGDDAINPKTDNTPVVVEPPKPMDMERGSDQVKIIPIEGVKATPAAAPAGVVKPAAPVAPENK